MTPPAARRFVPRKALQRFAAWLAVWPIAYLAMRAVTDVRELDLGGAALLAMLVAVVVRVRATPPREAALDADARSLAPVSAWLAIASVLVELGARTLHVHVVLPAVARAIAVGALVLAVVATTTMLRLRRWVATVNDGVSPLRTRSLEDVSTGAVPLLSDVEGADALVVDTRAAASGPYRAEQARPIARVPKDVAVLARRYGRDAGFALLSALLAAGACALGVGPLARVGHPDDLATTPTKLPALPAACASRRVTLRFAALEPLRVVDVEAVADHYRRARIPDVDVAVERPLAFEDRFVDRRRAQLVGEEIASAAREQYGARAGELVVIVTDRDMFLRDVEWRYAFATRDAGIAVVSVARMDPAFPLLSPATYASARPECTAVVRARAFRMITRQILLGLCSAGTIDDPSSARRRTVLGLPDLDAVREDVY